MNIKNFSVTQLADMWMAQREAQNVMGKYVYYSLLKKEKDMYDEFWCRKAPDPALGVNTGFYKGYDAIKGYYDALFENTEARSKHMQKMFPDYLGKYSDIELHGVGSLNIDALTSGFAEVAEDCRTAKGLWCVMGLLNDIFPQGPYSMLNYGYFCVDFINEDGDWKIWHLQHLTELDSPVSMDWSSPWEMPAQGEQFKDLAALKLPEPNVKTEIYRAYSADRQASPQLKIPQPYKTFAETFSYGA